MRKIVSIITVATLMIPHSIHAFSDLSKIHVNSEAIFYLRDKGIVAGYPDGSFRPDATINRAEFTKIVIGAAFQSSDSSGSNCFPDVKSEWFAQYVCAAKKARLLQGYPDGTFKPENPITFVEAAKIISIAYHLSGSGDNKIWYEKFVTALEGKNAIPYEIESLDKKITRSDMAEIMYRLHAGRSDKPSQSYAELLQKSRDNYAIHERVLVTLPTAFNRYSIWGEPILDIDETGENHVLVIPMYININQDQDSFKKVFINGSEIDNFGQFVSANFTQRNAQPVYVATNGTEYVSSGLPNFKTTNADFIRMKLNDLYLLDSYEEYFQENVYGKLSHKEVAQILQDYNERVAGYEEKTREIFNKGAPFTEFLFPYEYVSAIFRNSREDTYLVIAGKGYAAKALFFRDGILIGYHKFENYPNIAENASETKFAYRAKAPDEGNAFVVDDGVEGKAYTWVSQPQYNSNDEVMYIGISSPIKNSENLKNAKCEVVIGTSRKNIQCNDGLFVNLVTSPFYSFPVVSPDGKTVIYPEVVKRGIYENDNWIDRIDEPPQTRLIVNGKPLHTNYYVDRPFFTSEGIALVSNTKERKQFVEWKGIKSPEYDAIGTNNNSDYGYGLSTLSVALHSYLSNDLASIELKPELIVSPDGKSIAFVGKGFEGWVVHKDMKVIGTYQNKFVDQLTFSPDSKNVSFILVDLESLRPWDSSMNGNYSVMVNDQELASHQKVMHLQYSPNGLLTYVAKEQGKYALHVNGKAVGQSFDELLMPPRFKDNKLEIGIARGEKIILSTVDLNLLEKTLGTTSRETSPKEAFVKPPIDEENIILVDTFERVLPPEYVPLKAGIGRSDKFYTNGKEIFFVSTAGEGEDKLFRVYLLNEETPQDFEVVNERFSKGKRVYATFVLYGENIKIISERAKDFVAKDLYATDGKKIFYGESEISADAPSFQFLDGPFAKDKFGVYYLGNPLPDADIKSFHVINKTCGSDSKNTYCLDEKENWIFKFPLMDADTLVVVENGLIYDKDKILCADNIIDLDLKHLKILQYDGLTILMDNKRAFRRSFRCNVELVEELDPISLRAYMSGDQSFFSWHRDAQNVFHQFILVPDADVETFRPLNEWYGVDAYRAFWESVEIEGADVSTFQVIDEFEAKDAHHVYQMGHPVPYQSD